MKNKFIVLGFILIFVIFIGLNWNLVVTPSTVNLLGYKIEAPLGLIMLSVLGLTAIAFSITIIRLKFSARKKERMLTKELERLKKEAEPIPEEIISDKNINEKPKKSKEMEEGLNCS